MFDGIHGQAGAVDVLARAIAEGRVAHAYAFIGPPGVGRKLTALAFARALLCGRGSCGQCAACRKVEAGAHPDVMVVRPTPPESNPRGQHAIRIEAIRELERFAALRPAEGAWKVFIVDDAGRMTPETPQAFLKTLEEPPARTVIVLILAQARELPPTVLSRCQVVRFLPLAEEAAAAVLEAHGLDGATARLLARASQGRPGLALAEGAEAWVERRARALAVLADLPSKGVPGLFGWAETVGKDRGETEQTIEAWWLWYRDLLCAKAGGDARLFAHGDREAEVARAAGARSWDEVLRGLEACREAWEALRGNVSPRLTLEVTLSRLAAGGA